ncbi:hypothetical protein ACTFIR_003060 [Dictyostelium discoideum]
MTKKIQFKGTTGQSATRWEKRWINVGHMKLLKWVPTKIKRPTPTQGNVRKEGGLTTRQTPSQNMETRYTRSNRRVIGDKKNAEHDEAFEMMYLNSLPKTRRTTKKMDLLQKKHLQDAGLVDTDLHASSADEKSSTPNKIIKTPPPKRAPGRVKSMLSPSQDTAMSNIGSDSELTSKSNDEQETVKSPSRNSRITPKRNSNTGSSTPTTTTTTTTQTPPQPPQPQPTTTASNTPTTTTTTTTTTPTTKSKTNLDDSMDDKDSGVSEDESKKSKNNNTNNTDNKKDESLNNNNNNNNNNNSSNEKMEIESSNNLNDGKNSESSSNF